MAKQHLQQNAKIKLLWHKRPKKTNIRRPNDRFGFNQKPPFFWSKTPKPSIIFFQKMSQTMKILFTLSKQTASVVSIILYSIIRNIAVRCSINQNPSLQKFFFKNCPTRPGSCQCIAPPARCKKNFKNCPTHPTFVVQVVFKLFQLFSLLQF